jgi:hypothetical protein
MHYYALHDDRIDPPEQTDKAEGMKHQSPANAAMPKSAECVTSTGIDACTNGRRRAVEKIPPFDGPVGHRR